MSAAHSAAAQDDSKIIMRRLRAFWFKPVSSGGFGLMRISYGLTAFIVFAMQWPNVLRYYSGDGILPHNQIGQMLRETMRFSLLDQADTHSVFVLYLILLFALFLSAIGLWTRISLLVSTILLFSFHEYGIVLLDGGDTMLRLIAFLLLLAPSGRSFSVDNLIRRLRSLHANGADQRESDRDMPAWPVYLLTWQLVWLYVTSAWMKLYGSTWQWGSAVAITLHHLNFTRLPTQTADALAILSPAIGYSFLIAQLAWGLLLILPLLNWLGLLKFPRENYAALKRAVIIAGVVMHSSIFIFLNVGLFSFAMMTSYLGLLDEADFAALRSLFNRRFRGNIVVLFDGRCGLCRRSILFLKMLDCLHRLELVNFHDRALKEKHAPRIALATLETAMHVVMPDGKVLKGYYAFRALCRHLPLLWIVTPFLYISLIEYIGVGVYSWVAGNRRRCHGDSCRL